MAFEDTDGAKQRFAIGVFAALTALAVIVSGGFSYESEWSNGDVHVATALSPWCLVLWPAAVVAVLLSWRLDSDSREGPPARWPAVLLALLIDGPLYLSVVGIPLTLALLWVESWATGQFAWSFAREYSRPSDVVFVPTTAASIVLWGIALAFPQWAARHSPGGLLAGVTLHVSQPVGFWRSSLYGWCKYLALAMPLFGSRVTDTLGGFQVLAIGGSTRPAESGR
jgi:hypothetical protein